MSGYTVTQLDEIEELDDGRNPWRPVRHHLGITSFGINAFTAHAAGDQVINEHDEAQPGDGEGDEELYLVMRGRATFELDGETVDAPEGTLVYARSGVKRSAVGAEAGTVVIAMGGVPGKAYEPHGWELWAPINPLYEEGRYDEAADRGQELLDSEPRYGVPIYNLACCESLAGRKAAALEHLSQAVELSERLRVLAKDDSDLDAIRDEPGFKELVGA